MSPLADVRLEADMLGALLLDSGQIDEVRAVASDFEKPAHATIFAALRAIHDRGESVDVVTLRAELEQNGQLAAVGGEGYLLGLTESVPTPRVAIEIAPRLRRYAAARALRDACQRALVDLSKGHDPDEVRAALASHEAAPLASTCEHVQAIGAALYSDLASPATAPVTPTGLLDLDRMLHGGLRPGNMVTVAARPAMGKSSFAAGVALGAARSVGPAVIFSLEMTRREVVARLLADLSGLPGHTFRCRPKHDQWSPLGEAVEQLGLPLWIDDEAAKTVAAMRQEARRIARRHGKLSLVVVDYIQLARSESRHDLREGAVAEISRGLKAMAKDLGCPVLALSQLNRSCETRADRRPMLSDLRESGAIEQDSDIVIGLYRDEVYNPETPDVGIGELIILKHRAGPTGRVRARWDAPRTRFLDLHEGQGAAP